MYLIIEIQTGDIFKVSDLRQSHYDECNDNIIDIIDISDSKHPEIYNPQTGYWDSIENY
jgi:hypothetical protein